jgi:hypothetical protein
LKDYRDPEGLTDALLVDRLLEHKDRLADNEAEAFLDFASRMYALSRRQRDWAERVYKRLDLQAHYAANLAPKKGKGRPHPIDAVMASRALQPPGRLVFE